ncbi:hypothetical protein ACHAXT_012860 [Thalassiosira profunda]
MDKLVLVAKMAVVFTVVDAFIPRAEIMAKSNMHQHHRSEQSSSGDEAKQYYGIPRYNPQNPHTEMHMGLFDLSSFHGGGSANKDALDEQWEVQQEILRARRDGSAYVPKRAPKVEIKSKPGGKVEVAADDAAHHQKKAPKFFWDHLGKSGH